MAEVIGVVSGAITFATVLAQITQAVIKLKDFRDQLHDAPEDLKMVVRNLEIFKDAMADMETQFSHPTSSAFMQTNHSAHQSFALCKEAADDLSAVCQDLSKHFRSSGRLRRSTAAVKIVMNRGTIERQVTRLQHAMQLLSFSQQCYAIALAHEQHTVIVTELARLQKENKPSNSSLDIQADSKKPQPPSRRRRRNNRQISRNTSSRWNIRLPSWITATSLEIVGLGLSNGWQWNLRTWNEVPDDADAFKAAYRGDLERVKEMILSKKASIYDRTPSGFTLLHCAARNANYEIFMWLVSLGADPDAQLTSGLTPGVLLVADCYPRFISQSHGSRMLALRALVERGDNLFYETEEEALNGLLGWCGWETEHQFLSLQQECCPSFFQMSPRLRLLIATTISRRDQSALYPSTIRSTIRLVQAIVRDDVHNIDELQQNLQQDLQSTKTMPYGNHSITFVHQVAQIVGSWLLLSSARYFTYRLKRKAMENAEEWTSLLCEMAVAGVNIHGTIPGRTLFIDFLWSYMVRQEVLSYMTYFPRWNLEKMNAAVNYWLKFLQRSGIDIEVFGQDEAKLWRDSVIWDSKLPCVEFLMGFSHGKDPQDWHVWIREPSDAFVGDFWNMVERRIEVMPGTWPEQ